MIKAICIKATGKLWKRGYRFYSMQKAVELGICGTVAYGKSRNMIVIIAEGNLMDLKKFVEWCSNGYPSCRIIKLETEEIIPGNYTSFDLIR
jgi:acylphosphatase